MAGSIASLCAGGGPGWAHRPEEHHPAGNGALTASFFCAFLCTLAFAQFSPVMYVLFAMVGIAWAAISVNSLPMVVEMPGGRRGPFHRHYYHLLYGGTDYHPIAADGCCAMWAMTPLPYAAIFSPAAC